jgi:hypothetical protein
LKYLHDYIKRGNTRYLRQNKRVQRFEARNLGLTEKDRKAIRDEVMAQTRLVMDALSTEELQNEGARRAYTCGAVETARQMINLQMAQTKRN